MKIQQLFDELKTITENKESVFAESGMTNWSDQMKYGFFPLGFGVLTDNIAIDSKASEVEISEGGVMVLGNDFGTVSYVEKNCNNKTEGERDISNTIRNLQNEKIRIKTNETFFSNFHLGVRLDYGHYEGTTMTKRFYDKKPFKIKKAYSDLCFKFFIKQLELVKPRKVICLGHEVKNALIDSGIPFHQWEPKSGSLKKLYSRDENNHIIKNLELNGVEFIVIPHPCYPVNLLKPPYLEKLNTFLKAN